MNSILVKRDEGNRLVPVYESDLEFIKKLPYDNPIFVTPKKGRNYEFHKKMFALFKLGHNNSKKYSHLSFDNYRKAMTMAAGFFITYEAFGKTFYEAESLAYEKMEADKFEECYQAVLQRVMKDIEADKETIEHELMGFL